MVNIFEAFRTNASSAGFQCLVNKKYMNVSNSVEYVGVTCIAPSCLISTGELFKRYKVLKQTTFGNKEKEY